MPPSESQRKQHALEMFEQLPAHYDELGAALSFFQDPRWRRAAVEAVAARPEDRVLDVACGTGLVSKALVDRWGCRVVGLDQSAAMLGGARAKLAASPRLAERIELVEGEAESLP
ncbi:MAG TPA: class I SAM-dependent methyltransferase, partial [Solirubrobacterales bacterium]|nr:class I SAM-dependent methyltransferase [Solirubrobacterales bacterium]